MICYKPDLQWIDRHTAHIYYKGRIFLMAADLPANQYVLYDTSVPLPATKPIHRAGDQERIINFLWREWSAHEKQT